MIFTITNLLDFQIINYLLLPFSDYGYLISLIFFMSAAIVGVVIVHFSARKGINALAKGAGYGFGLTAGHRAANIIADSLEGKDRGGSNNGSGDSSGSNSGSDNSKESNSGSDNSKDSKTGSDNSKDSNNGSDNSKDSNSGSDNSKDSKPESNNSGSSNSGSK